MHTIPLPTTIKLIKKDKNQGTLLIEPCFPGYGVTLGNALRRVLISSLEGGAITNVKVKGVDHEFSTLPYIKEGLIDIILNLKLIRFKIFAEKPLKITLKAKGAKVVKAKDIKLTSDVKIANPQQPIATLTDKKANLEMELTVQKGRGYWPVEAREGEEKEIGEIKVDAIFSPIEKVTYQVENVRVGKETNFDRLLLTIKTDGTLDAREAMEQAARILVDHFALLGKMEEEKKEKKQVKKITKLVAQKKTQQAKGKSKEEVKKQNIEALNLSGRTLAALQKAKIRTLGGITRYTEEKFLELDGIGESALKEVKKVLKKHGLEFK